MHVDVGVVTWNTRDLTVRALRRLLDSDQGVDVRVLVRDNGSRDGTVDALARQVPEADVEAGRENLGFAAGVNTLLARSAAPYFFVLNSDAWPEPGALATLVRAAEAHPRAALVAPRVQRPDGSLEHSTHPFPSLPVAAMFASGVRGLLPHRAAERLMLDGDWRHDSPRWVDWAVGAAWLLPRRALDVVGPLDERFFMYAEDVEWCWRARDHGLGVWFEPAALVVHVGNASGAQAYATDRTAAYLRNTQRLFQRRRGGTAGSAYRLLNLLAATRLHAAARRRRDGEGAAHWRAVMRVHAQRIGDADEAPGAAR